MNTVWRWTLRSGVGLWLALAVGTKLRDPHAFFDALAGYPGLPDGVLPALGWLVLGGETVVAAALLVGRLTGGAWALAQALGVGFVVFTTLAWLQGGGMPCGCFGETTPLDGGTVARAVGFAGLAWLGQRTEKRA